jgi:hypothetical protein
MGATPLSLLLPSPSPSDLWEEIVDGVKGRRRGVERRRRDDEARPRPRGKMDLLCFSY